MTIVAYVCAEFRDASGAVLFRIRPEDRRNMIQAPDSIRQDPLFDLLVSDGSLRVPANAAERKALENDPGDVPPAVPAEEGAGKAPAPSRKSAGKN